MATSIIATPPTITKTTIAATISIPTVAHATLHRGTTAGTAHSTTGNIIATTYPTPPLVDRQFIARNRIGYGIDLATGEFRSSPCPERAGGLIGRFDRRADNG
ncbi:hypothetical protein [Rhodococcus pyridinivorans]